VNKDMLEKLLKENCSIKPEVFEKAREIHKEHGGDIGHVLVRLGAITEAQFIEALAAGLNLAVYHDEENQDNELIPLLEESLDIKFLFIHQIFPLKADRERGILYAVTDNPFQHSIFDYASGRTGLKIVPVLAPEGTVKELIRGYRGEKGRDFVSLDGEQDMAKLKEMALKRRSSSFSIIFLAGPSNCGRLIFISNRRNTVSVSDCESTAFFMKRMFWKNNFIWRLYRASSFWRVWILRKSVFRRTANFPRGLLLICSIFVSRRFPRSAAKELSCVFFIGKNSASIWKIWGWKRITGA
jgi:hypothetical protein